MTGWSTWRHLDPRTAVVVGVGVANQRFPDAGEGGSALDLMLTATGGALADSGVMPGELAVYVGLIATPHGTWLDVNPGGTIATAIGASAARTLLAAVGIPQQTLINRCLAAVRSGEVEVAIVVGGEAAHRAAVARRAGVSLPPVPASALNSSREPDERMAPVGEIVSAIEIAAGVYAPAPAYALIDSALRHAEGRTLDEHRDEVARLWAGFNAVAGTFPHAAFPTPRNVEWLREGSAENRPIVFPYHKWHCSQSVVDQAAAIVICSLGAAERLGVDPSRVVFPLVALESSDCVAVPRRRAMHRWPAMEVLGETAAAHLSTALAHLDHHELYSCFPAAVRVQQRALGLPADGLPTITGGETFAGGPWNNFVLQATAALVERVRGGGRGLVTTVSGFLHKPGLAVYSATPDVPLLLDDLADSAAARTDLVELTGDHEGVATVAAYTVSYDAPGVERVIVIADTPDGRRTVATKVDPDLAAAVTAREFIGAPIHVSDTTFAV